MKTTLTTDEAKQQRLIARHEMFEHSYAHKRRDPDNCAACALTMRHPNYAGWPLIYVALGLPMNRHAFIEDIKDARDNNTAYLENVRRYINTFGHPGYKMLG